MEERKDQRRRRFLRALSAITAVGLIFFIIHISSCVFSGDLCCGVECGSFGKCDASNGTCTCNGNWIGDVCDVECGCNGHGTQEDAAAARLAGSCDAGSCRCDGNWIGDVCDVECGCNGHGSCDHWGYCTCDGNWVGDSCDIERAGLIAQMPAGVWIIACCIGLCGVSVCVCMDHYIHTDSQGSVVGCVLASCMVCSLVVAALLAITLHFSTGCGEYGVSTYIVVRSCDCDRMFRSDMGQHGTCNAKWKLGPKGQSCTTVCSEDGLVCGDPNSFPDGSVGFNSALDAAGENHNDLCREYIENYGDITHPVPVVGVGSGVCTRGTNDNDASARNAACSWLEPNHRNLCQCILPLEYDSRCSIPFRC